LDFGLPVELRDKFIDQTAIVAMPKDSTNRDFWANTVNGEIDKIELPYKDVQVQQALGEMAKKFGPSARRNLPKVCTFYVRGLCTRGVLCPYRHEKISDEDLESMKKGVNVDERIRERFHGINDPIAKKILDRVKETNLPKEPEDPNITTLFLGNVDWATDPASTEAIIRQELGSFGKIKAVKIAAK
jgi:pre-mRNA-splicing factor RBM22/SLT11